jgi:precorrin-6Y C5,15-methyltransferase (decarboxylating)
VVVDPAGRPSYPPVFDPSAGRPVPAERGAAADPPDEPPLPVGVDPAVLREVRADRERRRELLRADVVARAAATPARADREHAPPIDIVGLHGGQWFGRTAEAALRAADVLIGHARQLAVLPSGLPGKPVELWGNLDEVLGFAAERQGSGQRACVLAAGDPGFFGLVRLAAARLGEDALRVHPAPSSVALAFARVGANWDDALVVSAHGRPLEHAVAAALDHPKVAVLVSKDQPPQALGHALVDAGCGDRTVAVCSRLGESDEQVVRTDLAGLAAGTFDALSVVLVQAPVGARPADSGMGLRWGRPEADFAHRDGMVTKAEVRAVALGKLGLPPVGTLWDVGAGSGSVAIECTRLAPGLRVYAVERRPDDVERIRVNAHGSGLRVVAGTAPDALADLPDPDRAFVGGGGLAVLDAVRERLRPGGVIVATYATLATAAAAADRLGNVVQVQVSRGVPVGTTGQLRLAAENPVFVVWGPT